MMQGGATVRSRKITIIKNAFIWFASLPLFDPEDYKKDEPWSGFWLCHLGRSRYRQGCRVLSD